MESIRQFLMGKRKGHGVSGLAYWIKVVADLAENDVENKGRPRMRELVSEQRAAGLNISSWEPNMTRSEWSVDY